MDYEYLVGITISLDEFAQNKNEESIINIFESDMNYKVHLHKEEYGPVRRHHFISNNISSDEYNPMYLYIPESNYLSAKLKPESWREEFWNIKNIIDSDDTSIQVYRNYVRFLDIDESKIEEYTKKLVKEIESIVGYDVTWETSSGTHIHGEEITKEYKTWIYIQDEEDNICPHSVDIEFTEKGPMLMGTVADNKTHDESFRELITNFSI